MIMSTIRVRVHAKKYEYSIMKCKVHFSKRKTYLLIYWFVCTVS